MIFALCQTNPTVGAFQSNLALLCRYYHQALEAGADVVVFPELVVTGYPPGDLLYESDFVVTNRQVIEQFASEVSRRPAIVGFVDKVQGRLFNCAALIREGQIRQCYHKLLLPTYDVFDEDRYFTEGASLEVWNISVNGENLRCGIEICEDLWDANYDLKVTRELAQAGAEVIINISASPYHEGRLEDRLELIRGKVAEVKIPFLYCNLVGGQDELIFDGQSLAVAGNGALLAQGQAFEEDLLIVDPFADARIELCSQTREKEIFNALCLGVRDYITKTGFSEVVIGLSGGIDSTLVAAIAAEALGIEKVHGIAMPSKYSSDHSVNDARHLAQNLGIDFRVIPIQPAVDCFEAGLQVHFAGMKRDITEENNQARTRGDILMAFSNKMGWLVLSCGNKTELALGYCTLYGDMVGGLAVISDLSKTDVYALARWINAAAGREIIPGNCLNKAPSAELAPGQVDPFDYDRVSPLVDAIVEGRKGPRELIAQGYDRDLVLDTYRKVHRNEYKRRQAAPGLRVSVRAFGSGRRIPIVNHFDGLNVEKKL